MSHSVADCGGACAEECLGRQRAKLELLQAAYPDEVEVGNNTRAGSDLLGFRFRACGETRVKVELDVCVTFPRMRCWRTEEKG